MFLITPIQAAAVIAGNCLFGKVYITLRWRWFGANKILGNLWKKAFVLPNTNPIKELQQELVELCEMFLQWVQDLLLT